MTEGCSLNGACGEVCPVAIPLPNLIRKLREQKAILPSKRKKEAIAWRVWKNIYGIPFLYKCFTYAATRFRHVSPKSIGAWTKYRTPPKPAPKTLHELMREKEKRKHVQSDMKRSSK